MPAVGGMPIVTAPILSTQTIDASTDFVAYRRVAFDTTPITGAEVWITTKTGTPHDLLCVLVADNSGIPNVSAGVPVDVGGGSPTLVAVAHGTTTTNTRLTITFTNAFTPVAGTYYWLVLYPGTSGGNAYAAGHRYIFRTHHTGGLGIVYGDENASGSTDSGATWGHVRGQPCVSWLKSGGFIPTLASCCFDDVSSVDVDGTSNPDERGSAWTNDANTNCVVSAICAAHRSENSTADFSINVYEDNSLLATRAIDESSLEPTAATSLQQALAFLVPQTVAASKTGRVTLKATAASDTIRFTVYEFGTQARRESVIWAQDWWYTNCNDDGNFTDDLTRIYAVVPHVSFAGIGGGGGTVPIPTSMSGGLLV